MIRRWRHRRRLYRLIRQCDDIQLANIVSFLSNVTGRVP